MTNYNRVSSGNVDAIRASDGVTITANKSGLPATWGVTLANGTTYFFPLGMFQAIMPTETGLVSTHFRWDASVIVTFTFESTNFPTMVNAQDPRGPYDVSPWDTTAGNWMQENPPGSYVSGSGSGGLTATNLSLVVAGGTAGGTTIHIGNFGTRRGRWRAVVGGTGGLVRCAVWGKGEA